jgi:hypothetical protein
MSGTEYAAAKDPGTETRQMVQVMAPSTLPAGYQFEAELGEKKFMATVVRVTK